MTKIKGTDITDGTVANAQLANMAESTIKGRASGSGAGAPQDLTAAQLNQLIGIQGNWTPTITFDTPGDLSVTYTTQLGVAMKIGTRVFLTCQVTFTPTFTTASGAFMVTLPTGDFPVSVFGSGWISAINNAWTWPAGRTQVGADLGGARADHMTIIGLGSGQGGAIFGTGAMSSGSSHNLVFSGWYETSA
jgi:hypothetical protein